MLVGIIIGRKGSVAFPGKNMFRVCGRPMAEWVMTVANSVCDHVYLSTDDKELFGLANEHAIAVIKRPSELCTKEALADDVFVHAKNTIVGLADYYALMMCNAPTFLPSHIVEGVTWLNKHKDYDSACTVSKYNWYHPIRARYIKNNVLYNYMEVKGANCDRDSAGDCWIYDCCCAVVRPRCIDNIKEGMPPQRWLGKKVYPIINHYGLDIDVPMQIGQVEWWLKKYGRI